MPAPLPAPCAARRGAGAGQDEAHSVHREGTCGALTSFPLFSRSIGVITYIL